jgi:hypothetical protein
MCGFCLAENFKYNSDEETILLLQYCSSSDASDLHLKVPTLNLRHDTAYDSGFHGFP